MAPIAPSRGRAPGGEGLYEAGFSWVLGPRSWDKWDWREVGLGYDVGRVGRKPVTLAPLAPFLGERGRGGEGCSGYSSEQKVALSNPQPLYASPSRPSQPSPTLSGPLKTVESAIDYLSLILGRPTSSTRGTQSLKAKRRLPRIHLVLRYFGRNSIRGAGFGGVFAGGEATECGERPLSRCGIAIAIRNPVVDLGCT